MTKKRVGKILKNPLEAFKTKPLKKQIEVTPPKVVQHQQQILTTESTKVVQNQGHQGDLAFRKIHKGTDGNYYVKVMDLKKSIKENMLVLKDKLFATSEQMAMELADKANEVLPKPEPQFLTVIEGEATHHDHGFRQQEGVRVIRKGENKGVKHFLGEVKDNVVTLQHYHVKNLAPTKEHDPIQLPKSIYEFRSQRELDFEKRIRPVVD